jgi:hypothetical protein
VGTYTQEDFQAFIAQPSKRGTTFSLSAPILKAPVQDLLDDNFHRNAWEVLRWWISIDLDNLQRIGAGLYTFKMPYEYSTNSTAFDGWAMRGTQGIAEPESIAPAMAQLKESLAWISLNFRKCSFGSNSLCHGLGALFQG